MNLEKKSVNEFVRHIDHTLLKPDATPAEIETLCREAIAHSFLTVCVNSIYTSLAQKMLAGSSVKPIAVVGFPLGACGTETKCFETEKAIADGAWEIDMVIASGALKSGNDKSVRDDIKAVVDAAAGRTVKVIIETALLNEEQKVRACQLAVGGGAQFVKTCTGFLGGAATVEDIRLMRKTVGPSVGVKASGGIRDATTALALLAAGADRLGMSQSVAICQMLAKNSEMGLSR